MRPSRLVFLRRLLQSMQEIKGNLLVLLCSRICSGSFARLSKIFLHKRMQGHCAGEPNLVGGILGELLIRRRC